MYENNNQSNIPSRPPSLVTLVELKFRNMEKDKPSPKPEEHSTISKSRRLESQVLLQSLHNMVSKGIKTEEEKILYLIGEGEEQRSLGPVLQIIPSGKETYIDAKFSSYIDRPTKWEEQYIFMEKELVINSAQNGNQSLIIVLCKNGCILVQSGAYVNFQHIDLVNRPIFIIKPNGSFAPIIKDNQLIRLKSGLHLIVLTNETILIFVDKSGLRSESNIGCGQYQPLLIGVLTYKKSGNISDSNEPKDFWAESIKEGKDDRKLNKESFGAYSILIEDMIHARNLGLVFSLRIGYGCFSDVFKGKFNYQTVAIKVIHHNKYKQTETYMQEKYVCGLLKEKTHKNIIKFSQVFDNFDKSETWILMEWLDGKDMEQILREKGIPFAEDVAKSYFKQLVDGLKFLHSLGIVHRDIKAENIILCRTENTMVPKFIDFGFAKKVDIKEDNKALCGSHKGLYQSTSFLCTLEYLAPEILSNTIIYDAIKSDIYSLGILLFVMLFKALPFSAENCEDTIEKMDALLRMKSDLNLHYPPMFQVSEKAKEFIKNILNNDSDKRLSVDQILGSDWLRNDD